MATWLRHRCAPLALLAAVSLLSLAARSAWLGQPCRDPCRSSADHLLVFDEAYYVNAARVIAGEAPPPNQKYANARLGDDPNAEHPQLAKLLMAGSIELFGDGPLAWRLTTLVLGTVAILGMFALARAAGAGGWLAVGAAALMAADNLLLVHGRIGTLDVPVLAAMIWAMVLYVRGRPLLAGAVIGVGTAIKLVAPYTLLVLVLLELLRRVSRRDGERSLRRGDGVGSLRRVAARLGACAAVAAGVFVGLVAILDRMAPPYDAASGKLLASGPFHHIAHMLSYGANQTSPHGPTGIASYPWAWLVDYKPIVYLNVNPDRPSAGLYDVHRAVHFLGLISPSIMLLAIPALLVAAWVMLGRWRSREPREPQGLRESGELEEPRGLRESGELREPREAAEEAAAPFASGEVPILAVAWFLGTFVPFLVLSLVFSRTSYLYYMVIVMPGIYLAVADLVVRGRRHRRLVGVWIALVVAAAAVLYPFTPLP